jgi:hypothetical protein
MSSPTARTLALLRADGWIAEVVEKWIPFAKIRKDFAGCIDIICFRPPREIDIGSTQSEPAGAGIVGVQATSTGNLGARIKKSLAEPKLALWKQSGGRFACIGWAKRGKRGERKTWQHKWVEL